MAHSTNILPRSVDYDQTLVLAIELSNKSWVLAAQVPGLLQTKAKRTIDPDKNDLLAAIDGYRIRAAAAGRSVKRVITSYEAGWCGFWLARWLMAHGVEVHVVCLRVCPLTGACAVVNRMASMRSCFASAD